MYKIAKKNFFNLGYVGGAFKPLACAIFSLTTLIASAEIDLGTKGAVAFGLDGDLEYDTNIRSDAAEDDDVVGILVPKVLYRYNTGSVFVDASVGMQIRRYNDYSEYDSENLKTDLRVLYPYEDDMNYSLDFRASFDETAVADEDLSDIVEKDVLDLKLIGKYYFNERYYAKLSPQFRSEETVSNGFTDKDVVSVPIDLFYRYSEALDVGVGYRYRDTNIDGAAALTADSEDHAVYFALDGEISPSVRANAMIGYQLRDFSESSFDDQDDVYLQASLEWQVRQQTSLKLIAGNEFRTSVANESIETLYGRVILKHQFTEKIIGDVSLGYDKRDYSSLAAAGDREDEFVNMETNVEYALIPDRLILRGKLFYQDKSSDQSGTSYDRFVSLVGFTCIF